MGPDPLASQDTSQAPVGQMQQQLQQIAQTPMQPVPQAGPDQGNSVKRFLTNFFYGVGQGALSNAGLPTDYQKQQQTIANNQRQQQLNSQAQETSSLIGLHQQQLQNEKQTYAQNEYENQQLPIPGEVAQHFPGQTTARRKDINQILTIGSALNQKQPVDLDDDIADVLKLPKGTQVDPRMIPILSKMAALNPNAWQIKDAGGKLQRVNKFTGEIQPVLQNGQPVTSNSMLSPIVRAQAMAAYGVSNVMDASGNPTAISRLQQLQTGAPTMTEGQTMGLQGDKIGVQTYLGASNRVEKYLRSGVLNDPVQRGIIARATEDLDKNPGATDSIISSYTQQGLSPEGADMIAAMRQMGEFGTSFKKYTGNSGTASDSLRATIRSNQPTTANSNETNLRLLEQDRTLAQQIQQQLQRPGAYAPKARNSSSAPQSGGGAAPEGTRIKMQDGSTQVKRNGKWVPE
jgi:hypothetical protein